MSDGAPFVDEAITKMRNMQVEFEMVAIYFSDDFANQWHSKVDRVATAIRMLDFERENKTNDFTEDRRRFEKAFEECTDSFRGITGELRGQLRKLIGVQ